MNWRYNFLYWIDRKRRLVTRPSKVAYLLFHILFPTYWMSESQTHLKYDALRDIYTIKGIRISGSCFDALFGKYKKDEWFKFIKEENGLITLATSDSLKSDCCGETVSLDYRCNRCMKFSNSKDTTLTCGS